MDEYPDPTKKDLDDPVFNTIWDAIKKWDLSRGNENTLYRGYSGATGNDVMHILNAIRHTGLLVGEYQQPSAFVQKQESYIKLLEAVLDLQNAAMKAMILLSK